MLQARFAKIGQCPDQRIWEAPNKKRRRTTTKTIAEKSMQYFTVHTCTETMLKCKCNLCPERSKPINATKSCNLGNHLKNAHRMFFDDTIDDRQTGRKVPLQIKRLQILQNCVETVSVNGRPFAWLYDSGYIGNIKNKLEKLKAAGMGITFSNKNLPEVKDHLKKMAVRVREKIRKELNGKIFSVMLDICTRNKRSIAGISVRFLEIGKIITRSIGMTELTESHTGTYLASLLFGSLCSEYGVEKWQVLCINTDNGANVLKMVSEFDRIANDAIPTTESTSTQARRNLIYEFNECMEDETFNQIRTLLAETEAITDDEALDEWLQAQQFEENQELLRSASRAYIGNDEIWETTGVNCVAHILQLGTNDGIKNLRKCYADVIALCVLIVKFLHLSSTRYQMKKIEMSYNLPRKFCKTRWGSKYMMVSNCCKKTINKKCIKKDFWCDFWFIVIQIFMFASFSYQM